MRTIEEKDYNNIRSWKHEVGSIKLEVCKKKKDEITRDLREKNQD